MLLEYEHVFYFIFVVCGEVGSGKWMEWGSVDWSPWIGVVEKGGVGFVDWFMLSESVSSIFNMLYLAVN